MTAGVAPSSEELEAHKRKILEYFVKTPGGTFAGACKASGVAFSSAYEWRKTDPKFNEDVMAARNAADDLGGDFAESKLMEAISNNELTGIIFYLKTKHKARGYVERQDVNLGGQKDNPIAHSMDEPTLEAMMRRYLAKKDRIIPDGNA